MCQVHLSNRYALLIATTTNGRSVSNSPKTPAYSVHWTETTTRGDSYYVLIQPLPGTVLSLLLFSIILFEDTFLPVILRWNSSNLYLYLLIKVTNSSSVWVLYQHQIIYSNPFNLHTFPLNANWAAQTISCKLSSCINVSCSLFLFLSSYINNSSAYISSTQCVHNSQSSFLFTEHFMDVHMNPVLLDTDLAVALYLNDKPTMIPNISSNIPRLMI